MDGARHIIGAGALAALIAPILLAGCAGGQGPGAGAATSAAGAPTSPRGAYRIEAVAPDFDPAATLAPFGDTPLDPREAGAYVGRAVIQGVSGAFSGEIPARLTAVIHRLSPATVETPAHRAALDFVLTRIDSGAEIGRSGVLRIEAPATPGAGPAASADRLSERISRSAAAWAEDLTCGPYLCPPHAAVAAAAVETAPAEVAPAERAPEERGESEGGFLSSLFGGDEVAAEPETAPAAAAPVGPAPLPRPVRPSAAPVSRPAPSAVPRAASPAPTPSAETGAAFVAIPQAGAGGGAVVLDISGVPALWDGEPTTGGVWIALPYAPVYRTAVIVNPATGEEVRATLLWRDPAVGGTETLISAAAAAALGVAPGRAAPLDVKIVGPE